MASHCLHQKLNVKEARRNADGSGEREAVVDLGRPLDAVLRPSAGNHERRLVMRRGDQKRSSWSVVGVGLVKKTYVIIA